MASKFLMAFLFCASACLPGLALASLFTGSYQPTIYYDNNIFDGVQMASSVANVSITSGAGPNDLNLKISGVSVPLVTSGNVATLAGASYNLGAATLLDVTLLSDGNNMALTYEVQQNAGAAPLPISFGVSVWQQNPALANTASPIGTWQTTTEIGTANLRDINGPGFTPDGASLTITNTANGATLAGQENATYGNGSVTNVPVTVNGGVASLLAPPVTTASSIWQGFNMMTDNTGAGAFFTVTTELNDPSDVAVEVALVTLSPVPEPETYAMMMAGLCIIGFIARRRKAV